MTSTLRFYTNVMKLGSRNPRLGGARQVGSVANPTNDRPGFGVGIGWAPEEFECFGVPYANRGKRVDEMIEVIKLLLGGGMVEFHGDFYDFDKLQSGYGRADDPFEYQAVCIDKFEVDGHRDLVAAGVTNPDAPVHLAGKHSHDTANAHDNQAWLDYLTDDAIDEGKTVALRAFWGLEKATASARKV